jgi:hypothetical protein
MKEAAKAHGLFPVEGDEEPIAVHSLTIVRLLDGGRKAVYPLSVTGEDCPDVPALFALVGGGAYDVQAKSDKGRLVGRRPYEFEGPPRPFPTGAPAQATAQPATQQAAPVQRAAGGGIDTTAVIIAMMQTNAQTQAAMFTAMSQMVAALSGKGNGGDGTAALVKSVLEAKLGPASGGNNMKELLAVLGKGMELGADMTAGGDEGSPDQSLGNMAALIKNLNEMVQAGKMPGQNAPGVPNGAG